MDTATSKGTVQTVVILLGVFAIASLGAVTYLIDSGAAAASVAIVSTPMGVALGSLGTLLASTRSPIAAQLPVVTPPEQIAAPPLPAPPAAPAPAPVVIEPHVVAPGLVTLEQQGIDPALGISADFTKNANAAGT